MRRPAIGQLPLTYGDPGATAPAEVDWVPPPGYRSFASTTVIGHGDDDWATCASEVFRWTVKTRSGFDVEPPCHVAHGQRTWVTLRLGPLRVREPVEVVAVARGPDRCGFAYGTLAGHPVSGEEAFVVHRAPDGTVWLTLRSLTRPPAGRWRAVFPVTLAAQHCFRRRYERALDQPAVGSER